MNISTTRIQFTTSADDKVSRIEDTKNEKKRKENPKMSQHKEVSISNISVQYMYSSEVLVQVEVLCSEYFYFMLLSSPIPLNSRKKYSLDTVIVGYSMLRKEG